MSIFVKSFPKPHRERLEGTEYKKFINSVFIRDSWMCRRCGARNSLTPHHIQKRSQLGGDTLGNVLTLCLNCHQSVEKNDFGIEITNIVVKFIDRGENTDDGKKT